MVLKILNLNIPLSFSSLYLDHGPGFGMAVMVATFMNSGICPCSLIRFNISHKEDFRSEPIALGWKSSAHRLAGYLALPRFKLLIAFSTSFMENGGLYFFQATSSFNFKTL